MLMRKVAGKWDAGMATWEHTPLGRGYETFFGYFHHANDCDVPSHPFSPQSVDVTSHRAFVSL